MSPFFHGRRDTLHVTGAANIAPADRRREWIVAPPARADFTDRPRLDAGTLRRLRRDVTVVSAAATADLLTPMRFRDVVEMGWGESQRFDTPRGGLSIEAFRVRHWGARMRHDVHRGFNGYVLERHGHRICIAGDTARASFTAVGRKPTDVMVVPIGAYNPWIASHCTPEQAAEMADEARARFVVPVHHQTFRLSWEPMDEPIQRLRRALPRARIALAKVGETFVLPQTAGLDGVIAQSIRNST